MAMSTTQAAGPAGVRRLRAASLVAWAAWGITAACLIGGIVISIVAKTDQSDPFSYIIAPVAVMGYATVGTLIVSRRQGNRIGWLLCWVAFVFAFTGLAGVYARYALDEAVRPLPAATLSAWANRVGAPAVVLSLPLLFLLFPDGRVPSRRWRPLLWTLVAAFLVNVVGFALTPGPLSSGFTEIRSRVDNPLGLPSGWKEAVESVTTVAGIAVFIGGMVAVVALIMRFRRARGDERQQIKWLAYVGAAAVIIPFTGIAIGLVRAAAGIPERENDPVLNFLFISFFTILLVGIPAACAIAAFKYRLYDLDIVVKKTVMFGLIALAITGVGLAAIALLPAFALGIGSGLSLRSVLLGVALGLLVWPFRRFASRIADRIVYGTRATPYEVLSEFSDRMAGTYSTDDVLPRMAEILGQGCGARRAGVWLRVGTEIRLAASWPDGADAGSPGSAGIRLVGDELPDFDPADHAFPVRHQGELLGALTVAMPATDPMNPARAKLARDVAAQAGLVLRNVRLIEELRASRRRIVSAQDERAKALERNIHDGAQQQLVALAVKARLAQTFAGKEPAKTAELLRTIQAELEEALENLRDLARGIYPPLLADKGLGEALAAQARKSPISTAVDADGIGRYPPDVEAAVYFCALEALQNTAKYSGASRASIRLSSHVAHVVFEVRDDGSGFDLGRTGRGTGLQGMADRLEALGGRLEVTSAPGRGTTVVGRIPVHQRDPG
jgi:signal transduction histidine kinase